MIKSHTDIFQEEGGESSSDEVAVLAADFHFPQVSIFNGQDGVFPFLAVALKRNLQSEMYPHLWLILVEGEVGAGEEEEERYTLVEGQTRKVASLQAMNPRKYSLTAICLGDRAQ